MTGFGDDLKHERESRGMTLEALAAETRVKLHYLLALEAGEYDALPGGLFRRSIMRAYLAAVGLEESLWLARFDESLTRSGNAPAPPDEEKWAAFAMNVKRNRASAEPGNGFRWTGVAVLFLLVAALAAAVWEFVLRPRL